MSDYIPKPAAPKAAGLSPKMQKLLSLREKAANANAGAKLATGTAGTQIKAKTLAGNKKTSFQRKAV